MSLLCRSQSLIQVHLSLKGPHNFAFLIKTRLQILIAVYRIANVPTEPQTPNAYTPKTFKPPAGFSLHEASQDLSSMIDSLLSRTVLRDKEVWYITAPASVSLEDLSDISVDGSSKDATARHQGVDYYIKLEGVHSNDLRLLVPRSARSEYQSGR